MDTKLDFLVIGAQKCATTWLYDCLAAHPELHLPKQKREIWYLGGDLYEEKGLAWYESLLDGAKLGQHIGDVSVEYLFDMRAAPVVASYAPNVRLIVSLRDPIDRAISAYYWYRRKRMIGDLNLDQALIKGLDTVNSDVRRHKPSFFADMIQRGDYGFQLQPYIELLGNNQILYLLYENIAEAPAENIRAVYRFLGVDQEFQPKILNSKPKQNTYNEKLILFQRQLPNYRIFGFLFDRINQLVASIQDSKEKTPDISPDVREGLREYYSHSLDVVRSLMDQAPYENRPQSLLSTYWKTF